MLYTRLEEAKIIVIGVTSFWEFFLQSKSFGGNAVKLPPHKWNTKDMRMSQTSLCSMVSPSRKCMN